MNIMGNVLFVHIPLVSRPLFVFRPISGHTHRHAVSFIFMSLSDFQLSSLFIFFSLGKREFKQGRKRGISPAKITYLSLSVCVCTMSVCTVENQ